MHISHKNEWFRILDTDNTFEYSFSMKSDLLKLFLLQAITVCESSYVQSYYRLKVDEFRSIRFEVTSDSKQIPALAVASEVLGDDLDSEVHEDVLDLELSLGPKRIKYDPSVSYTRQNSQVANAGGSNHNPVLVQHLNPGDASVNDIHHYFPDKLPEELLFSWTDCSPRLYFKHATLDDVTSKIDGYPLNKLLFGKPNTRNSDEREILSARITLKGHDGQITSLPQKKSRNRKEVLLKYEPALDHFTKILSFDYGSTVSLIDNLTCNYIKDALLRNCPGHKTNSFPCTCVSGEDLPTIQIQMKIDKKNYHFTQQEYIVRIYLSDKPTELCYLALSHSSEVKWTIGAAFARRYDTKIWRGESTKEIRIGFLPQNEHRNSL